MFVGLVPDKEVRVSVKALAVSCVGAAAALLPETFFNRLYLQPLDGQQADGKTLKYAVYFICSICRLHLYYILYVMYYFPCYID